MNLSVLTELVGAGDTCLFYSCNVLWTADHVLYIIHNLQAFIIIHHRQESGMTQSPTTNLVV